MVRLERTALAREFEQKIDQIFGIFTDDPLTNEAWERETLKLNNDVTRYQVDLHGELDVLRTTAKELHDMYYKRVAGKSLPFGQSKVCEAIEFVQGVMVDLLYNGAGLAVEDALKVVKRKYQECLDTIREQHDEGDCEFARAARADTGRLKEDHLNTLTQLREEHDENYCDLARAAKEECARLGEEYRNSLTQMGKKVVRNGERKSAKHASNEGKIKELKKQRKDLKKQLKDQEAQVKHAEKMGEELTQKLKMAKNETMQTQVLKARIEEKEAKIESLQAQLAEKENLRSSRSFDPKDFKKSKHFSSQTVATTEASSVASNFMSSDLVKQETFTGSSELVHRQGKLDLVPSSSATQSSPSAQLVSEHKRKRSESITTMPNPDSIALVAGRSDNADLTSTKRKKRPRKDKMRSKKRVKQQK